MLFSGFFIWWYGEGLVQSFQIALAIIGKIADFFSLETLVKTWLAPWKNDVTAAQNLSLGDQLKIWQMNFVSRLVGFVVRTIIIAVSIVLIGITALGGGLVLGVWLLIPLLVVLLPVLGVRLLFI